MKGTLYLLPNVLGENVVFEDFFSKKLFETVSSLQGLIAESEKGGWRYLRHFFSHEKIKTFPVRLLNEHTKKGEIEPLLQPILAGEKWGIVSDAGLCAIADPGAELVFAARKKNIQVEAFPGPSSIILALMLSGFSGQNFSFYGYLPIETKAFQEKMQLLEKDKKTTHLWMETPYRVVERLKEMVAVLRDDTLFALAVDITLPTQEVVMATVGEWKRRDFSQFHKRPSIFLMGQNPFTLDFRQPNRKKEAPFSSGE